MKCEGIIIAVSYTHLDVYKRQGYNIIFLSILSSVIVAVFSLQNPVTVLNETFVGTFSGFIKSWFLVYVLSATFAKLMGECGAARSIALKIARLCLSLIHITILWF